MKLNITETIRIKRPLTDVFDYTYRIENMRSFTGYGPIPGIQNVRNVNGGACQLGSRREITKTDGTIHKEEIIVKE